MARIAVIGVGIAGITQGHDLKKQIGMAHEALLIGESGVASVAIPQMPPRNTNWASRGEWVHFAKVAYEKYFLHKVKAAKIEPYYEKTVLRMVGATRLKESTS